MTFDEALSYLLSLGHETLTIKLGLKNTEVLLAALGNPEKHFPAVQIAGTNGKGSTAVMLDSICRAAGIRTGVFTSPHLISITERVRINGEPISEVEFAHITGSVKESGESLVKIGELETLPTFFEQITAIALLAFRVAKIDLAILETGLGGRLDSTTAAHASIVALTPIAMDHEEYLGKSLREIAAEKAAIIRPGVRAIVAPQTPEALEVIRQQCEASAVEPAFVCELDQSYPLASAGGRVPTQQQCDTVNAVIGTSEDGRYWVEFETNRGRYEHVLLGLRGRHQITNGAVAIAVAEALGEQGFQISNESIKRGLETANHAGRLEIWNTKPRMLFDGAHNPSAAQALRNYLDEFVKQPITMIFGAMRDKALDEMASILFPIANELILTEVNNPRSATASDLQSVASKSKPLCRPHLASSPEDALRIAKEVCGSKALICITGSLYLVGETQKLIKRIDTESHSAHA